MRTYQHLLFSRNQAMLSVVTEEVCLQAHRDHNVHHTSRSLSDDPGSHTQIQAYTIDIKLALLW